MGDFNICNHVVKRRVHYPSGRISVVEEQVFPKAAWVGRRKGDYAAMLKRPTLHTRSLLTRVPVKYIARHQQLLSKSYSGTNDTKEPHLDNFSIANYTHRPKFSNKKLQNIERLFTHGAMDIRNHTVDCRELSHPKAQSPEWFDRVVLFKDKQPAKFASTFREDKAKRTFAPAGYSDKTIELLNELSNIRFVTQKLSQDMHMRSRPGKQHPDSEHLSLYPHL